MKIIKLKKGLTKKLNKIITAVTLFMINCNVCFAESAIGTAEVQTATDNIKRVIISIAMPLRRSINFCKYCNCCN